MERLYFDRWQINGTVGIRRVLGDVNAQHGCKILDKCIIIREEFYRLRILVSRPPRNTNK
jgi:hypothetical protein